jgi:hypothetical protein
MPACPRERQNYLKDFSRAKFFNQGLIENKIINYFLFIQRSATPVAAMIPVSIPDGDVVVRVVATGAGLVVVPGVAMVGALVVAGVAARLADNDGEFPRTTTFCVQS